MMFKKDIKRNFIRKSENHLNEVGFSNSKEVKIGKIPYTEQIKKWEETIDVLGTKIGRLENKAIRKLIEDLELGTIMSRYLSYKDQDIYYRSREKLSSMLKELVGLWYVSVVVRKSLRLF